MRVIGPKPDAAEEVAAGQIALVLVGNWWWWRHHLAVAGVAPAEL